MEQMVEAPVTLLVTMRELPVLSDRLVLPEELLMPAVLLVITTMLAQWVYLLMQQEMLLLPEALVELAAVRDMRVQPDKHTPRQAQPVLMAAPEAPGEQVMPEASLA